MQSIGGYAFLHLPVDILLKRRVDRGGSETTLQNQSIFILQFIGGTNELPQCHAEALRDGDYELVSVFGDALEERSARWDPNIFHDLGLAVEYAFSPEDAVDTSKKELGLIDADNFDDYIFLAVHDEMLFNAISLSAGRSFDSGIEAKYSNSKG
ncbi:hypothetical protein VNI00_016334 [Paramarasmius palmivorus]|uniref:Uncharacterized protein n=1 Tax=Paramarasmius palmivorus TaxID=297713 RepID=A0AAW0BCW0_9AGAR